MVLSHFDCSHIRDQQSWKKSNDSRDITYVKEKYYFMKFQFNSTYGGKVFLFIKIFEIKIYYSRVLYLLVEYICEISASHDVLRRQYT